MSDKTHSEKQIYRVLIKAPIETVWSELVSTASPRPFFYDALCDADQLAPGGSYRMVSKDKKNAFVVGEVLEFKPPHLYSQTFKFTTNDDPPCKVTYTLKEKDDHVEFSLITENIVAGSKSEKSMADGGKWITENFKAYVETGKVTFGARMMLGMMSLMGAMMPKATRIENWPHGKHQ